MLTTAQLSADVEHSELSYQLKELEEQLKRLRANVPQVMVMADMPSRRDTFLLNCGLYNNSGKAVNAAVPASLPGLPAEAVGTRLDLARWLMSPQNPLTARPGLTYGASDELGFNAVDNRVHVHHLQATLLHQLGIDHEN